MWLNLEGVTLVKVPNGQTELTVTITFIKLQRKAATNAQLHVRPLRLLTSAKKHAVGMPLEPSSLSVIDSQS
jgi:hypothetical protein